MAPDGVLGMAIPLTEPDVRAQAEARGYWLMKVPGTSGYSLTRPPESEPLTLTPLSLEGIVEWLSER